MRILIPLSVIMLSACTTNIYETTQDINVQLVGTTSAYCILSTPSFKYGLMAPGTRVIQRSEDNLKIDCRDNLSERRRTMTIQSTYEGGFEYKYDSDVTVDFSVLDNGNRYNGYRAETTAFSKTLESVLTEDSYSDPVVTEQTYPVQKKEVTGRKSYPIPLTDNKQWPDASGDGADTKTQAQNDQPYSLDPSAVTEPVQ